MAWVANARFVVATVAVGCLCWIVGGVETGNLRQETQAGQAGDEPLGAARSSTKTTEGRPLSVADFLPGNYVRDGSVSYAAEVQRALDAAARTGGVLQFPAMTYAVTEEGWRLPSGVTLRMHGAVFRLSERCRQDGAVFKGHNVTDVTLSGGDVVGRNGVWPDGVNVRGVQITGRSARLRIRDMAFRDLSSNGIGLFGEADAPIHDVWVRDVIVENCCKRYPDYLSGEKGEPGSQREDQGDVAFYYVDDFVVDGCRFERSRSDGTHFYRCRRGQITNNRIYRAKMGGYFVETCEDVVGRGNVMVENGSRGVTIERGSRNCVFSNNVVLRSGREGLWAPDCIGLVVTGNVFNRNGRKPNGPERRYIWNANITINEAHADPSNSPTRDYLVSDNLIYTTPSQVAAIRVDATQNTSDIVIHDNLLLDDNRRLLIEGPNPSAVHAAHNHGARLEKPHESNDPRK